MYVENIFSDFENEEDLLAYLHKIYDEAVENESNAASCAQCIVNVSLHFIKSRNSENPQVRFYVYCKIQMINIKLSRGI